MTTWLVAVHILVTAETTNPRAHIAEALEARLDGSSPSPDQAKAVIIDWAVAGEDLAASMAPAVIPPDYETRKHALPAMAGRQGVAQRSPKAHRETRWWSGRVSGPVGNRRLLHTSPPVERRVCPPSLLVWLRS